MASIVSFFHFGALNGLLTFIQALSLSLYQRAFKLHQGSNSTTQNTPRKVAIMLLLSLLCYYYHYATTVTKDGNPEFMPVEYLQERFVSTSLTSQPMTQNRIVPSSKNSVPSHLTAKGREEMAPQMALAKSSVLCAPGTTFGHSPGQPLAL